MDALSTAAKRKYFFALLYFCEGAPIGFIWWMLPTQLRSAGVPVERITLMTSLLVLPWALKFLWAPAVDLNQNKRWTLKSWIVTSQIMMSVSMIPLLILDLSADYQIVFFFLLLHTISAATQDVAIDALCITSVPLEEQGRINGWMQAGMLAGRSVFGGIALMVSVYLGVISVLTIMIVMIITVAIMLTVVTIPQRDREDNRSLKGILQS
ncbi:MAG: MFS transporter, partial [Bacteroidetes bacterium]|nr:MFS transporter [Bacteroidota bacterium]